MKIRVIFHDEKISWDKKWIFLGSSYKNLKTAEKKISGPRLKINNTLHEVFKKELHENFIPLKIKFGEINYSYRYKKK